ncbi:EGF-like protein growth factor [Tanapox virus]|uniref:EGF-like protein growth factor n=1 Tax=Tanapox virus TaxID=99000 RepID=A7XCB9_9POXV|nr:EGF-like protein growth factor [Tanapox virus]ABQ43642.1 EGF-like protein growth factor [Tanapox virus]
MKNKFMFFTLSCVILALNCLPLLQNMYVIECDTSNFCLNGGTCFLTKHVPSYSNFSLKFCLCKRQFNGKRCENKIVN